MTRRRWWIAIGAVVALPVLLLGALATESGSRWALQQASRLAGDTFSFSGMRGALLGGSLILTDVSVDTPGAQIRIPSLEVDLRPAALLQGTLHLRRVAVAGPRIRVQSANAGQDDSPPGLPMAFRIDALEITDAGIAVDGQEFTVDSLHLEGSGSDGRIVVERMSLRAVAPYAVNIDLSGEIAVATPFPFRLASEIRAALPDLPPIRLAGTVRGDRDSIDLSQTLTGPGEAFVEAHLSLDSDAPQHRLQARWNRLEWIRDGARMTVSDGGARVTGSPQDYTVAFDSGVDLDGRFDGRLHAEASGNRQGLAVKLLSLRSQRGNIEVDGEARWSPDISWSARMEGSGIDLAGLLPTVDAPMAFAATLDGALGNDDDTPTLDLTLATSRLELPLGEQARLAAIDLHYAGDLPRDPRAIRASLSGDALLELDERSPLQLDLEFDIDRALARLHPLRLRSDELVTDVTGTVSWGSELGWQLAYDTRIDDISVFVPGRRGDVTASGEVSGEIAPRRLEVTIDRLAGTVEDAPVAGRFRVDLVPDPAAASWLPGAWNLSGSLEADRRAPLALAGSGGIEATALTVAALELSGDAGSASVDGSVAWSPHVSWEANVAAEDLDPGYLAPDWPGRLNLAMNTSGALADQRSIRVSLSRLDGLLRGYPLQGLGELSVTGDAVELGGVSLRSGSNSLDASGRVGERGALEFTFDAPDLDQLWPGLSGNARGSGTLGGSPAAPRVQLSASATDVAFRQFRVATVTLEADIPPDADGQGRLSLDAGGIAAGDRAIDSVAIDTSGTHRAHRIALTARAGDAALEIEADGGLVEDRWEGTLRRVDVDEPVGGGWRLEAPAMLSIAASRVSLPTACLARERGRICAGGDWEPARGARLSGTLADTPLSLLGPLLPDDLAIDGSVDGSFEFDQAAGAPWLRVDAEPGPGSVRYQVEEDTYGIGFGDARITGTLEDGALDVAIGASLSEGGRLSGRLRSDSLDGDDSPLDGSLDVVFPSIAVFSALLPRAQRVDGAARLDLAIAGTLDRPQLTGSVALEDGVVAIPDLGITLSAIGLTARSDGGDTVFIDGSATSGGGAMTLSGSLDLDREVGWPVNLALEGSDFTVVQLSEAEAAIDTRLRITGGSDNRAVSGRIDVPRARVRVSEPPAEVQGISPDEVIVGPAAAEMNKPDAVQSPVSLDVSVGIGDAVRFEGLGLVTRLTGSIDVKSRPDEAPRLLGQVRFVDGRYRIFGQTLTLEQGTFAFIGPPTEPTIDIRAVRRSVDGRVKAGIHVSGPARRPEASVYSEPELPETAAMSYLLTGRGPESGAKVDGGEVLASLAALRLSSEGRFAQGLRNTFGIDVAGVEERGEAGTSLVLGKYLTPDLYLGYAYSLFDTEAFVELNYRLMENLRIETQSGARQAVDLIYSIERDGAKPDPSGSN